MKPTLSLTTASAMLARAYPLEQPQAQSEGPSATEPLEGPAAEVAAWEPARTPGDIRRALSHRAEVPGKNAGPGPWVALAGYALALLALVGGLAWVVERLPPGVGGVLAAGATVGVVWVVLGGGRR